MWINKISYYFPRIVLGLLCIFSISLLRVPSSISNTKYANNNTPTIIFDLGGVLVDTNKWAAVKELGLMNALKNRHTMKHKLYEVLNHIQEEGNDCNAHDYQGNILPGLMCDWLCGIKTTAELRDLALPAIEDNVSWFANKTEQEVIYRLVRMMFTPERFVHTRKLLKEGAAFVKACKEKGYRLFVLSNWDPESFALMREQYHVFFSLFDEIIISGDLHAMKPQHQMYTMITSLLPGQSCIFIDDQQENITAAQEYGIHAIHYSPKQGRGFKAIAHMIETINTGMYELSQQPAI